MGMIKGMILQAFLLLSCSSVQFGTAVDTITASKSITYQEAIISGNSSFQLGFFSPANSTGNLFVGIWYHGIDPAEGVIWVLNRVKPLKDSSGILKIAQDGNLVLLNGQKKVVWSSNVKNPVTSNTAARLLDSGNLVLQDKATGAKIWESFEHPSDVGVSTMRISVNVKTGEVVQLTSWKSPSDPSIGNFSFGLDPFNFLQIFVWKNSQPYWRSGPWNGQIFVGIPDMYSVPFDGLILGFDEQEGTKYLAINYVNFYLQDFRLDSVGRLIHRSWNGSLNKWDIFWSARKNECDSYGHCGPFGSCASQKPTICSCLPGFEPKNTEEWNRGIWTNGCVRRTMLQCNRTNSSNEVGKEDWFFKLEMVKLPDFFVQWSAVSEYECRKWCLKNCSCVAYAYPTGLNCLSWNENLTDIRKFSSSSSGTDLYLRLAYSERADLSISPAPAPQPEIGTVGPPPRAELHRMKKGNLIIVIITIFIGTISISAICIFFVRRRMAREKARPKGNEELLIGGRKIIRNEVELQEVPLFKFEELATATSNFNIANLLGKGGFGPVHRGTLQNGQEIAVKRLSRASGQGSDEFMNEVLVISNLQHRNLVKLLGCCVEGEEKILVYEYMPNNSLDTYLFDSLKKELLDWKKRFKIIEGISRGLLYLHRDSRLRIIHRDLKASNILLDKILQPKISDFGLAKIFGGNEDQANTKRIVGTRGYMSPEYAMEGLFSEKSDIYSYGVLLLEIISGRRNTGFYNDEHLSLVGYAWKLWKEGNILALVDNMVSDPCHHEEVLRGIHVGLLCVQEFAKDRPNMSTVISMLNSEIMDLPSPKQPAFTLRQNNASDAESCTHHDQQKCSINYVTLSNVEGR